MPLSAFVIIYSGNCLSRTGSLFAYGTEQYHADIRLRISMEMIQYKEYYMTSALSRGLDRDAEIEPNDLKVMFERSCTGNIDMLYNYEINCTLKHENFMGLWQLMALSSVLGIPIRSVYPEKGPNVYRRLCNRIILPRLQHEDMIAHIMWASYRSDVKEEYWVANHFCPMLPMYDR